MDENPVANPDSVETSVQPELLLEVSELDSGATDAGPPLSTDDPLIGKLVADRYQIVKQLGAGAMGAVYLAEHVHMKKAVALKMLHAGMSVRPEVVARFEREAFVAGRIDHPNVAQATDFGQLEDGTFYLVLELLAGRSLDEALQAGPLPVRAALQIAGQVAEALNATHQQGIVHRDLKPENIMLLPREDDAELVKVVDFGIAKLDTSVSSSLTLAGMIFGTPKYMAPEQAAGKTVDPRADLYSLGVVLYEMLTGKPPFDGDDVRQVLVMHLTQPAPPLPAEIPEAVRDLTLGLLEKDPELRIASATEVVDRIVDYLSGEGSAPSIPRTRMQALASTLTPAPTAVVSSDEERSSSRGYALWLLLGAGALGALIFWFGPKRGASEPLVPSAAVPEISAASAGGETNPGREKTLELAIKGDEAAVAALQLLPTSERGGREWSALARGLAKLKRDEAALTAYRELLQLDASAAADSAVLNYVWRMATAAETSTIALDIAAHNLGARGADILYHVWVSTRARTSATELAERLVTSEEVRRNASPALRFVIDLRLAENDCAALEEILPRGTLHGDTRSFRVLQRLKAAENCSLPVEALDAALAAVQERPAPQPF